MRTDRRIASIAPTAAANGAALNTVLARWRASAALDDAFADQVGAARAAVSIDDESDSSTA